jgi:hypothetical protein
MADYNRKAKTYWYQNRYIPLAAIVVFFSVIGPLFSAQKLQKEPGNKYTTLRVDPSKTGDENFNDLSDAHKRPDRE